MAVTGQAIRGQRDRRCPEPFGVTQVDVAAVTGARQAVRGWRTSRPGDRLAQLRLTPSSYALGFAYPEVSADGCTPSRSLGRAPG